MKYVFRGLAAVLFLLSAFVGTSLCIEHGTLTASYLNLPLSFIRNEGQMDRPVLFYEQGSGHLTAFTSQGVSLFLARPGALKGENRHESITLAPLNASPFTVTAREPREGRINYLRGKEPSGWKTGIPTYGAVLYKGVYPGIDMKFYGTNSELEYDVIVAPEADPSRVLLSYTGAEDVALTPDGGIEIVLKGGSVFQKKPFIYQTVAGARHEVQGWFVLTGKNTYGFVVGPYDAGRPLVIDPGLVYSTYLTGSAGSNPFDMAVDSSGNAYVTGSTSSTDFPVANPAYGTNHGGRDAFVTKIAPGGGSLVYSTYIGGTSDDTGNGIAVDSSGNAYVVGSTTSTDFPLMNATQGRNWGASDAFVLRLSPAGDSLVFSTYMGGASDDYGNRIAVDSLGNAYVAGTTSSTDFYVASPFQGTLAGGTDAFAAKLSSTGTLVYSTYLGGAADDSGYAVAVDSSGNAYVTGGTFSADFPVANALQATNAGGKDAFVTKFGTTGLTLIYSTYLGGSASDECNGIVVDSSGNVYVAGSTYSRDFPVVSAYQGTHGGGSSNAFVTKISSTGASLVYSTYLGGNDIDQGYTLAVDPEGNAYVAGYTTSANFPMVNPYQAALSGPADAFVSKIGPAGSTLLYSTYLGGTGTDLIFGIAVDAAGVAYAAGSATSIDFPTVNPMQTGGSDSAIFKGIVSKLGFSLTVSKTGDGSGTVTSAPAGISCGATCAAPFGPAAAVILSAVPGTGSSFAGWTGCDSPASAAAKAGKGSRTERRAPPQCTVTMNSDKTVSAAFTLISTTLSVNIAGSGTGTLSATGLSCVGDLCTGTYPYNTSVTITATPGTNVTTGWTGCDSSTGNSCTIAMTADRNVTATFGGNCTYTVAPRTRSFTYRGGSVIATVTGRGSRNCATPSVRASDTWIGANLISFTRATGRVRITVPVNSTTSPKNGTVSMGGFSMSIAQTGAPCTVAITPLTAEWDSTAHSGAFAVASPPGCNWTAAVSPGISWITITGGTPGSGDGTVAYDLPPNTSRRPRVGTIRTSLSAGAPKTKVLRVRQNR